MHGIRRDADRHFWRAFSILLAVMAIGLSPYLGAPLAGASGAPNAGGNPGWNSDSSAANIIPGPTAATGPSSDVIGGGGGDTDLGLVPYFALPEGSSGCGSECQAGWTDLVDNGTRNGGPIQ